MLGKQAIYEEAIDALGPVVYKEALRLEPNSALTLNNLGSAYTQIGDFRQAIPLFKALLRKLNLADAPA